MQFFDQYLHHAVQSTQWRCIQHQIPCVSQSASFVTRFFQLSKEISVSTSNFQPSIEKQYVQYIFSFHRPKNIKSLARAYDATLLFFFPWVKMEMAHVVAPNKTVWLIRSQVFVTPGNVR
jgi:hypothetical protein